MTISPSRTPAHISRARFRVRFPRRVYYRKSRQKTLQVQPQVTLGRRFPPPVFGPVHAQRGAKECRAWNGHICLTAIIGLRLRRAEQ